MKKLLYLIIVFIIHSSTNFAQNQANNADESTIDLRKNSFYIEILGNGGVISINYDRIVPLGDKSGLGFRIGAGTAGSSDTATSAIAYTALIEINFLFGKNKHFLETGIGFTNAFVEKETEQWCSIKLGYRYQAKKGFLLKIVPMYIYNIKKLDGNSDVFGGIWVGVSLGYSF